MLYCVNYYTTTFLMPTVRIYIARSLWLSRLICPQINLKTKQKKVLTDQWSSKYIFCYWNGKLGFDFQSG